MSSWQFFPEHLTIRNVEHGTWEIDLKKLRGQGDLLHLLLQAAKHDFEMPGLFQEFARAMTFCFGMQGDNGALMLQDLFKTTEYSRGPVDWTTGQVATK